MTEKTLELEKEKEADENPGEKQPLLGRVSRRSFLSHLGTNSFDMSICRIERNSEERDRVDHTSIVRCSGTKYDGFSRSQTLTQCSDKRLRICIRGDAECIERVEGVEWQCYLRPENPRGVGSSWHR